MAAPTLPTLVSITTEGLKKAGNLSPTVAQLTRAQNEWIEEIKNDIWQVIKNLTFLQTSTIQILTNGRSRYSMPTDFSSGLSIEILDGRIRGTAQEGTTTSITLASSDTSTDIIGSEIVITSGTGINSISRVTAFNSTTKVVTVAPVWVAPASNSEYMIIDTTYPLIQKPIWELRNSLAITRGIPTHYYPVGDSDDGEFELYPIPYQTDSHDMVCRLTYYADLMEIDITGTLMATLYKRWRNIFTQGVFVKELQNINDNRTPGELGVYGGMLKLLNIREKYGDELNNLTCAIGDF